MYLSLHEFFSEQDALARAEEDSVMMGTRVARHWAWFLMVSFLMALRTPNQLQQVTSSGPLITWEYLETSMLDMPRKQLKTSGDFSRLAVFLRLPK